MAIRKLPRGPLFFIAYIGENEVALKQFTRGAATPTTKQIEAARSWCDEWIATHPPESSRSRGYAHLKRIEDGKQALLRTWLINKDGDWEFSSWGNATANVMGHAGDYEARMRAARKSGSRARKR